jgi:two-component system LytT family sensor kinase
MGFDSNQQVAYPGARPKPRRWPFRALILGVWTLMALLRATQVSLGFEMMGHVPAWWRLAIWQLLVFYVWIVLTPMILWLGHRFKLERSHWLRSLSAHLLCGSLVSLFYLAIYTCLTRVLRIYPGWPASLFEQFVHFTGMFFHLDLFTYGAILGIALAADYYRKFRENELQSAELRAQLSQAQLEALRLQLQPHFLFNTLNSIVGLIRNDENKDAIRMTSGLSKLLRHVLEHAGEQEVSLREEVEFLSRYLEIQQMRFSDRLTVEMKIDPDTLEAGVPSLILQPIVENSIRHGVAARDAPGTVSLSASRHGGYLEIIVYNDGPALPKAWQLEDCAGIGLANTRARIDQLYGKAGRLEVRNRDQRGVKATLTFPFRPLQSIRNGVTLQNSGGGEVEYSGLTPTDLDYPHR